MCVPIPVFASIGVPCVVIVFPILSSVISLLCGAVLVRDARARPRPDKIVWAIAFLMFALAAGADAAGRSIEWTPWLARLYYATGPALVVMFLAIGELYLLFPRIMARFGVGATVLLSAFWVAMVLSAPIDESRLAADGWEAIERSTLMVVITVLINSIGTTIIVGGTLYSVWRFWRQGIMRNRMIGCSLIALGTITVGAGGTLTRLGHYEYLYIAMSVGAALIFAGVLWTRRPDVVVAKTGATTTASAAPPAPMVGVPASNGHVATIPASTHAQPTATAAPVSVAEADGTALELGTPLGYIELCLLPLEAGEIERICAEWSIPVTGGAVLTRDEARQAWRLRSQLSGEGMRRFDQHPVMVRRLVTSLHDEVLSPWSASSVPIHPERSVAMHDAAPDGESDAVNELATAYS